MAARWQAKKSPLCAGLVGEITASAVCGYLSAPIGRDKPCSPVLVGAYLRLPTIWQRRGALFFKMLPLFMLCGLADVKRRYRAMIAHDTSPDFAGLAFFLRDWLHGACPEVR